MEQLVLTIIGHDRAGVVAALAEVIKFHGGDWQRSELAEIGGTFAGVVVVGVPDDELDGLLTSLVVLRGHGVHVTAQQVAPVTDPTDAVTVHLRLRGDDRPGAVHEISQALSQLGISIARLGTVTGLPGEVTQFEFTARLAVPVEVGLDQVRDALDALDIHVEVTDLTADET